MDKHNTRYVLHNVKHLYIIYSRLYYQVYPEQTFGTIKLRMKWCLLHFFFYHAIMSVYSTLSVSMTVQSL